MGLITILLALAIILGALLVRNMFLKESSHEGAKKFSETVASFLFWGVVLLVVIIAILNS